MANKLIADVVVKYPRGGDIIVQVPIDPDSITGPTVDVGTVTAAVVAAVASKLKITVTNGRKLVAAVKAAKARAT